MKKIEYKPPKWEKRKAILIENSKYDYDEVRSLIKLYHDKKIDQIRYHYTLSLCYQNIAEDTFVQNDYLGCYENIERSLNAFITSTSLLKKGKGTNQATAMNIEDKIDTIDEDATDEIRTMECAISQKNSNKFQEALVSRMKTIRKFNLDNDVCADFITMALIKEAKKPVCSSIQNILK